MSFDSSLAQTVQTLQALSQIRAEIDRAGELIVETLRNGRKLLICGNGGSAAEASHFATELTGRYFKDRRPLPAIALSADGSLATCIGNDYGFEQHRRGAERSQAHGRQERGIPRPWRWPGPWAGRD
jgi:D-sedoheptulose 7-phosphate isomerase